MKQIIFTLFVFFLCKVSFGQGNSFFGIQDTLKYGYHSAGSIDSIDIKVSGSFSNVPGNSIYNDFIFSNLGQLANSNFLLNDISNLIDYNKRYKFTASPHLGFNYAFGSKGTQNLNFDYQQALNKNWSLNLLFYQNSSQGMMKNSSFSNKMLNYEIRKKGKRYLTQIIMQYGSKSIAQNGGAIGDSSILYLGLEYADVRHTSFKENSALHKFAAVQWSNYFNFLNDSLKGLGIVTSHDYKIKNRVYKEEINSYSNYSSIYIDSLNTRDQYQVASIANSAGFYLQKNNTYFDVLAKYKYWDYQNLAQHRDTTEINLVSNLNLNFKGVSFKNSFDFNIVGAKNEWIDKLSFTKSFAKINAGFNIMTSSKLPVPFQRFYHANNFEYLTQNLKLQTNNSAQIDFSYTFDSIKNIAVSAKYNQLLNNYFFIDSVWRNDTLNSINVFSISVFGTYNYKKIHFQPRFMYNQFSNNFKYIPQFQFNSRLYLKGKAFKSKKLEFAYGVDVKFNSFYELAGYIPVLDVITFNNPTQYFTGMLNMDAFFNISLKEFRMYAKYNNIGYFWSNRLNQQLLGYPIQKNYIQLGITWDFVN